MQTHLISELQSKELLDILLADKINYTYNIRKNELEFYDGPQILLKFRIPISISSPNAYYNFPQDRASYVLILIRSGIASVGYFEDGEVQDHKVIRAYMVRKKQGKSQIKYLKTKGKSRAGSRVRLASSLEFFEKINERLLTYFSRFSIERIGLSCPATLIPYFYGSKNPPPFGKADKKILRIPMHVQNPTYETLEDVNAFMLKGELKYTEEGNSIFQEWTKKLLEGDNIGDDEDNW